MDNSLAGNKRRGDEPDLNEYDYDYEDIPDAEGSTRSRGARSSFPLVSTVYVASTSGTTVAFTVAFNNYLRHRLLFSTCVLLRETWQCFRCSSNTPSL